MPNLSSPTRALHGVRVSEETDPKIYRLADPKVAVFAMRRGKTSVRDYTGALREMKHWSGSVNISVFDEQTQRTTNVGSLLQCFYA